MIARHDPNMLCVTADPFTERGQPLLRGVVVRGFSGESYVTSHYNPVDVSGLVDDLLEINRQFITNVMVQVMNRAV